MAYSDKVIDHYENPRNVGSLPKDDAERRHRARRRAGMRRRDEAAGQGEPGDGRHRRRQVQDVRLRLGDRQLSLATEWLKGKTVDEALAIKNTDIVNELSLPPVKIHCSVLAEDAIKAAIADYKKKQEASSGATKAVQPTGMITISETAARKIRTLMAKQGISEGGLRVGVKGGGCSGLSYTFAWEREARLGDEIFEGLDGAKIFVDKKSLLFLNGTVLDYDTNMISKGFVFNNPNAKTTCGCGSSFGA